VNLCKDTKLFKTFTSFDSELRLQRSTIADKETVFRGKEIYFSLGSNSFIEVVGYAPSDPEFGDIASEVRKARTKKRERRGLNTNLDFAFLRLRV